MFRSRMERIFLGFFLRSSSYAICMGTALTSLALYSVYAYNEYKIERDLLWNFYGMVLLTFNEYMSHRFILHFSHDSKTYHYLHGNHHLKPLGNSIHIPILYTSTMQFFFFWLAYTYMSFQHAVNLLVGYQLSYIIFEHIHMEVHHPRLFLNENETFRVFHMYHHTVNKHMAYSFSVPFWDIVFGTFPNDVLTYNMFAFVPVPFLSFYFGVQHKQSNASNASNAPLKLKV